MLAVLDVAYDPADTFAVAACVTFGAWSDPLSLAEHTADIPHPNEYEPGAFYKRELPCLLAALDQLESQPNLIIVDGYVTLGDGKPGLGYHLFDALKSRVPVVGVAKTSFHSNLEAIPVLRGSSKSPLFVTAVGMDVSLATQGVQSMHGPHRVPTLLRRVDALCRARLQSRLRTP